MLKRKKTMGKLKNQIVVQFGKPGKGKSIGENSIKIEVDKMTEEEKKEFLNKPSGMSIWCSAIKTEIENQQKDKLTMEIKKIEYTSNVTFISNEYLKEYFSNIIINTNGSVVLSSLSILPFRKTMCVINSEYIINDIPLKISKVTFLNESEKRWLKGTKFINKDVIYDVLFSTINPLELNDFFKYKETSNLSRENIINEVFLKEADKLKNELIDKFDSPELALKCVHQIINIPKMIWEGNYYHDYNYLLYSNVFYTLKEIIEKSKV